LGTSYLAEGVLAQRTRILRILAGSNLGRLLMRSAEDDDGDEFVRFGIRRRRRRARLDPNRFPKVPSDNGAELMNSGSFGSNEIQSVNAISQKKKLARRILDRELGMDNGPRQKANQRLMAQVSYLP
jgi:DDB1- and CUL4-associated factor 11